MRVKYFFITLILFVTVAALPASAEDITRSDIWLDSELTTIYALNEHLNPFDISVDVKDGVVSLGGEVESSIEKSLAVEIARGIDGVKGIEDNIKINPSSKPHPSSGFMAAITDASLVAKVKSNLLWNKATSGMDINVDAENRVVTLSGNVSSDAERELAVKIAENTSDVLRVNDTLSVSSQPGTSKQIDDSLNHTAQVVSDAWITAKIKARLLSDKHTDGFDINVTTQNGVVTLDGYVPGIWQREYAVDLAQSTVHVNDVVDKLKIKKE